MAVGDRVLCVFENRYRFAARVTAKFDNEKFATRIWGTDPNGKTWRLVYFMDAPVELDIPVARLSSHLGAGYMGFTKLSDDKIRRIEADFGTVERFFQENILSAATSRPGRVYALIRSNEGSGWNDEPGKTYRFGSTVPNYSRLLEGATVIVDTKLDGAVVLVGHGELGRAQSAGQYSRDSRQGTHYQSEYLRWEPFRPPRPLDEESLRQLRSQPNHNVQHAIRIIDEPLYRRLTSQRPNPNPASLRDISDQFAAILRASQLNFGTAHEAFVRAFIASAIAKPFLILTGISGSGKSQIALRFGEWLGERMLVAPVRPDWTGSEALFGFEDALRPPVNGSYPWHVPPTLEFMLKAAADPDYLYVLLLDEMNLSHVERYFADALSGMESGAGCLPNLTLGQDGCWRLTESSSPRIPFPRNLLIVGTVNVDETTYMFSPKVLDRAHTFEFRVTSTDLDPAIRRPTSCAPAPDDTVRTILLAIQDHSLQVRTPYSRNAELVVELRRLHALLEKHSFEFGHRVFYEAIRFAAVYEQCGDSDLAHVLDRIILQKLLPRLHGSRRRLELLLLGLCKYCVSSPPPDLSDEAVANFDPERHPEDQVALPQSFAKLRRMVRTLRANQFVSFSE